MEPSAGSPNTEFAAKSSDPSNAPGAAAPEDSHSAGLTVHGFRGYAEGEAVPSVVQILDGERPANSGAIRVDLKPGTQERYSGGGYVVMHQLIRATASLWEAWRCSMPGARSRPKGMRVKP